MGLGGEVASPSSLKDEDLSISELHEKHRLDLENLTLMTQPCKTLQLFIFATVQYLRRSFLYVLRKGGYFRTIVILTILTGFLLMNTPGPHEKHLVEFLHYARFGLWWVALGVASSIGLGSGLHTFVMYLGPHIAFFTIKALQCGRVDLKIAPYDTIQLKKGPSWLDKDCLEFGPPLYLPSPGSLVGISVGKILPQIQLEAILWGIGTALGELPPYFISRAAQLSGSKLEAVEELDSSSGDERISGTLSRTKRWLLSHSQHLNFFTILLLASVPNPLFDLAGIMCGQFGIPFWEFFLATLIGKAIIKTHLQTIFIIALCNNQLLELVNRLIWLLGYIPGFSSMLPTIVAKLHMAQEKYLSAPSPHLSSTTAKGKQWTLSFASIWNTVVWIVLVNFFAKIVTSIAQRYLKEQQDLELATKLSGKAHSIPNSNCATDM
ncbi:vacuole membrane protein KMS1-like isoform X1 [Typha angustifolia]|uniref:vacuole membrane protein KMS1-like isoform X1 n=1 Tax=Typha angustifolia TaxID=59011 RepID=UPI003C2E79E2